MHKIKRETLKWYAQFSLDANEEWDHETPNIFKKVPQSEISTFELETGRKLPESYIEFLTEVGYGRLTKSTDGKETFDYSNYFMNPTQIKDVIEKKTYDWTVYPQFIDDDDLPFFDLGNQSNIVFRITSEVNDLVSSPFLYKIISNNFDDFLFSLKKDCIFYINENPRKIVCD